MGKASKIENLRSGMTQSEVINLLGQPDAVYDQSDSYVLKYALHAYFKGMTYHYLQMDKDTQTLTGWSENMGEYRASQQRIYTAAAAINQSYTPTTASTSRKYEVESSVNDEVFVIEGEVFKAKVYCFNVNEGDKVIFIEGKPGGTCVSAEFINLRTSSSCRVWCE